MGRKRTKGQVKLTDVQNWVNQNEILKMFQDWKDKKKESEKIEEPFKDNIKELKKEEFQKKTSSPEMAPKQSNSKGSLKKQDDDFLDRKPLSNKFKDF
jgi:hypothetical protein